MSNGHDQQEDTNARINRVEREVSSKVIADVKTKGHPLFVGTQLGPVKDATPGCMLYLVCANPEGNLSTCSVYQLQDNDEVKLVASNIVDFFSGTPSDETLEPKIHPVEPGFVYSWLDKAGYELVFNNDDYCTSIWEGMRMPFVAYRAAKAPAFPASSSNKVEAPPPKKAKVMLKTDPWMIEAQSRLVALPTSFTSPVNSAPSKYVNTRKFMYSVPTGRLPFVTRARDALVAAAVKSGGDQDDRRFREPLLPESLRKQGMSVPVLSLISVCDPGEVLAGTVSDLMLRIMSLRPIPISTYTVSQLMARWTVPDGFDGLDMFNDLVPIYGHEGSKTRLREYRKLFSFTPQHHSESYEILFKGSPESSYLDGQIDLVQRALFNLLTAIAVSTCMSFAFQDALFSSGLRLIEYFHRCDFGQRNPLMLPFMKVCVAEMMTQWEGARQFMGQWTDKAHILSMCIQIPNLNPREEIDGLYQYYHLKNQGGDAATMLISSLKQGPQGGNSICGSGAASSSKKKKVKKSKTSVVVQASGAAPGTASNANTGAPKKGFCSGFNSSTGCSHGVGCNYTHSNPPRASPDAIRVSQYLARKGLIPSVGFVTNSV
jgi:hypothetical protein